MRSGLVCKILIVALVVIYGVIPYTINRISGGCRCGCQELICHCCSGSGHFCDMAPVMACTEDASGESYEQSPAVTPPAFHPAAALTLLGRVSSPGGGSALAGYRDPPMRPPRPARDPRRFRITNLTPGGHPFRAAGVGAQDLTEVRT
jgi:hypothetical protein